MRILIDVNLSRSWKQPLIDAGYEATHWEEVGPDDADDAQIMKFADENGYAIFTNDLDFAQMVAQSAMKKPSVIQLRSGTLRPAQLQINVIRALRGAEAEVEKGAIVTIMPEGARITILPIHWNTQI